MKFRAQGHLTKLNPTTFLTLHWTEKSAPSLDSQYRLVVGHLTLIRSTPAGPISLRAGAPPDMTFPPSELKLFTLLTVFINGKPTVFKRILALSGK